MKTVRISVVAAVLVVLASASQASDPFYTSLLTRGISDAQRGDHFKAAKELRIAAFGLVDDAGQYLRAQVYLAAALERLGKHTEAAAAVDKAAQAERIGSAYASVAIDPDTRSAFEALAVKSLRPEQLAMVPAFRKAAPAPKQTAVTQPPPAQQPVVTQKAAPPPVVEKRVITAPAPTPAPQKPVETNVAEKPAVTPVVTPPKPAPPVQKPVQKPAAQPPATQAPATPTQVAQKPAVTQPRAQVQTERPAPPPVIESPLVAAAKHQPSESLAASDSGFQIGQAQQLLNEGKILAARQIYLHLAQSDTLSRATTLDVAKGLNLTSAWRESSIAYQKVMPFRAGEEMHQFYEAVNRYELGDANAARDLLTRALPSLPVTRETSLYKAKILGMP